MKIFFALLSAMVLLFTQYGSCEAEMPDFKSLFGENFDPKNTDSLLHKLQQMASDLGISKDGTGGSGAEGEGEEPSEEADSEELSLDDHFDMEETSGSQGDEDEEFNMHDDEIPPVHEDL